MNDKPLQELLDLLLSRLHIDNSNSLAQMMREWIEIVGPDIAPHAKLYEITNNILIIETDHPAWSNIILMKKKTNSGENCYSISRPWYQRVKC